MLLRTGELLGEDVEELQDLPEKRSAAKTKLARMTAMPGDTLAIYIENNLPSRGSPVPVMQAGTNNPVIGYPIPVSSSGEIILPELAPIQVASMQLTDIQKLIIQLYGEIVSEPLVANASVDMLAKAGDVQELRSLSSPSAAKTP